MGLILQAMPTRRKRLPQSESAGDKTQGGRSSVANVEPVANATEVYSLQRLLTNKANPRTRDAARLGEVLLPWFEKVVAKPAEKLAGVVELWQALVPERLAKRSRLLALSRGTLSVAVDSASLLAELDGQLRGGVLRQLQAGSHGSVYRVKTCVQAAAFSEERRRSP